MSNKIYAIFQRSYSIITCTVLDYEDTLLLFKAYDNEEDTIRINGREITICYKVFQAYDISEKYQTIDLCVVFNQLLSNHPILQ